MNLPRRCLLLLVLFAPSLWAAEPWLGAFVSEQGGGSNIDAAIEAAVANMNFIKRPVARRRLESTNAPYARIEIQRTAESISIAFDGQPPVVTPADGRRVKWRRSDGEVFDVWVAIGDGGLVQTFKAEDGQRVNTFRTDDAGRLTLLTTITSPQLPSPLRYELHFARASPAP